MAIVLAGDTGGSKTWLGLFEADGDSLRELRSEVYRSSEFDSLAPIVAEFLAHCSVRPEAACFGLAGPIIDGCCEITNLRWMISAEALALQLNLPGRVFLINDLVANAYGIAALAPSELFVLQEGRPSAGHNQALIAAGTGLGMCMMYWDGACHVPVASEGGNADWAPHDETQIELWRYLRAQQREVGVERVVSGPGLVNCYTFLRDTRVHSEPDALAGVTPGHYAATVVRCAEDGSSRLCQHALDIFLSAFGAVAGDVALQMLALGGVYIGGGIAPKLRNHLDGSFLRSFHEKYLLGPLMADIPIKVILNDRTALLGAARYVAEKL